MGKMAGCLGTATGGLPIRYRSRAGVSPEYHACRWLVGRFGHRSRKIVGIAGFPGGEAEKRQKGESRMKKSAGKGQSSGGLRESEGAKNMLRATVRAAGRPGTPGGGPANHPGVGWPGGTTWVRPES